MKVIYHIPTKAFSVTEAREFVSNTLDQFEKEKTNCILEDFVKNLPENQKNQPIGISCPCKKCSPFC